MSKRPTYTTPDHKVLIFPETKKSHEDSVLVSAAIILDDRERTRYDFIGQSDNLVEQLRSAILGCEGKNHNSNCTHKATIVKSYWPNQDSYAIEYLCDFHGMADLAIKLSPPF